MRDNVINVGRIHIRNKVVNAPWWYHCPLCPTLHGFMMFKTQEGAFDGAERHLFKHHPNAVDAKSWFEECQRRIRLGNPVGFIKVARGA